MSIWTIAIFLIAGASGAVATVTGFGIGSLLTPLLASQVGTKTAVAAVAIPHLVGTTIRFWRLRHHIDRRVLWRFGVPSAAGGLAGALLHAWASSPGLAIVFGALLILAGLSEMTGMAERWRLRGHWAWIAGVASGLLGGLVGNQGGIRSAAMFGFNVSKEQFVATSTAAGLLVDAARVPVYVFSEHDALLAIRWWLVVAIIGVSAGTLAGGPLLKRLPEDRFRQVVGLIIFLLGLSILIRRQA